MKKNVWGLALLVLLISTPVFARDFVKNGKLIVVSITDQKVYAIENAVLVRKSSVVTGKPIAGYRTPTGNYTVLMTKNYHKFISPVSKNDPRWYAPSNSYGAVKFGNLLYIHDADEWRNCYGIACKKNYLVDGSHGCINVSRVFAQWLVSWTPIGTPVTIISESMNSYFRYQL